MLKGETGKSDIFLNVKLGRSQTLGFKPRSGFKVGGWVHTPPDTALVY